MGEDEFGGVEDRHRQQGGAVVRRAWSLRSKFEGKVRAERWKTGRGSEAIVSVEAVNQISGGNASIETNNRKQKIEQGSAVAQPRVFEYVDTPSRNAIANSNILSRHSLQIGRAHV